MINVAVIGLGYMGQNHARVLSGISGVTLTAVCDSDPKKVNEISSLFSVKGHTDFKELIAQESLGAVFICLPTSLHYESALYALKLKIPVFVEKPICQTISQAKKLISISSKYKVPLMVGHIERFNPVVSEIRNRIKSGELGKLIHIHTQRFSPPPTRAQDVSAIVDLATHDIDVINFLVEDKPIRVFAETDTKMHKKEDLMSALLRFKSGLIALVEVSWLHPTKIRSLAVVGSNGMYVANYLTQELFFYKQKESVANKKSIPTPGQNWADVIKIAFEAEEPLSIELRAFVDALKKNAKMPVTSQDGLDALLVIDKISKSGANHKISR